MKTIFLDRDNTLNHDPGYLNDPEKLELKEGVIEGLRLLQLAGFKLIVITNQSGIMRGLITEDELNAIHLKLKEILAEHSIDIEKIYHCPDKDDSSPCRKPNPQMIQSAINEFPVDLDHCYIIGDRYRDILTGESFAIPGILIQEDTAPKEKGEIPPNLIKNASCFLEAAEYVLQSEYEKNWRHKIYTQKNQNYIKKINEIKKGEETIVFTNGCFDLWHSGHLQYLGQAAELGDHLVIGLNSDASTQRLKGKKRPVLPEWERALKLAHLPFVSIVIIFNEDTPIELIKKIKPNVHVKGGDYEKEKLPEYKILKREGAQVIILPFKEGLSTTAIIKKIGSFC